MTMQELHDASVEVFATFPVNYFTPTPDHYYTPKKPKPDSKDWAEITDQERLARVREFEQRFFEKTGNHLIVKVEGADYKPPYAMSWRYLPA